MIDDDVIDYLIKFFAGSERIRIGHRVIDRHYKRREKSFLIRNKKEQNNNKTFTMKLATLMLFGAASALHIEEEEKPATPKKLFPLIQAPEKCPLIDGVDVMK